MESGKIALIICAYQVLSAYTRFAAVFWPFCFHRLAGERLMNREPEILPPDGTASAGQANSADSLAIQNMDPASLALSQSLRNAARSAGQYMAAAKSEATRRAYASDWRHFAAWCEDHGLPSLPATPDTVTLYIATMADPPPGGKPFKASTITRRLSAINTAHKAAGFDSPAKMDKVLVAETLHGIRRTHGTAPAMKKPLTLDKIVRILGTLEGPIAGARDKALLLLGFVGGLRRSELAALRVEHLSKHRSGYTIRIPRSKTDQEGKGREIEIVAGTNDLPGAGARKLDGHGPRQRWVPAAQCRPVRQRGPVSGQGLDWGYH
jgi:integrase